MPHTSIDKINVTTAQHTCPISKLNVND